jgi:hypothetical protein
LDIILADHRQFTASDYIFGIFKLFLCLQKNKDNIEHNNHAD